MVFYGFGVGAEVIKGRKKTNIEERRLEQWLCKSGAKKGYAKPKEKKC